MKKQLLLWSMLICIFSIGNAQVDANGNIIFADPIFECALTQARVGTLVNHDPNQVYIDEDGDGKISVSEARNVISLHPYTNTVSKCGGVFTDLTGIGEFTNLISLVVPGNNITTADLSRNLKLADINLRGTGLESINLGNNLSPIFLKLSDNNLTSIDVSKNINIDYLELYNNPITDIDVSNNTLLEKLYISNTNITDINLSNNTLLETLDIRNTLITSLDARNCSLTYTSINDNPNLREAFLTGQPFAFFQEGGPAELTFRNIRLSNCPNLEFICVDQIYVDEALAKKAEPNHSDYTVSSDCDSNGMIELEYSDVINLYPNPTTTGELNLSVIEPGVTLISSFITNLAGQPWGYEYHGGTTDFSGNYFYLPSGQYIIETTTSVGVFTTYFIKN